jgi:hypothetical protein
MDLEFFVAIALVAMVVMRAVTGNRDVRSRSAS